MPVKSPIAWPNGKVYMFQVKDYIRYDFRTGGLDRAALSIAPTNWSKLRGTEYRRYDIAFDRVDPDYPNSIMSKRNGV
jgi:hypothetical protein